MVICDTCHRSFKCAPCFDKHKKRICNVLWKCKACKKNFKYKEVDQENHVCGETKCTNCWQWAVMSEHKCFIQKANIKKPSEKYIWFDFESFNAGVHVVNLAIAQDFEGKRYEFIDIDSFCIWMFKQRGYTFIAHYAKGYDTQFIASYCINNGMKPEIISTGNKIMLLNVGGVRIIDSINFIPMPLRNFPKTFDLEAKKGYFPHKFNKPENLNYIGPIPSKDAYGHDQMRSEERALFHIWYSERQAENYVFDFKKELRAYCIDDVNVLRLACIKFREIFISIANIDPFQYVTIASLCLTLYTSNDMPENVIAIDKKAIQEKYSKKSIAWLEAVAVESGVHIQHAQNGGEKQILNYKVDGYCDVTRTVYEFQGCFWHGCSKCFEKETINPTTRLTMGDLNKRTLEKQKTLTDAGYKYVEIWECDPRLKKIKIPKEFVSPLEPRDAFFGGRTNATKLKYTFKEKEVGRHIDVCSLYPTVNYYDSYPVGYSKQIIQPDEYDSNWFGYIKCKILPPHNLYHPVLATKVKCGNSDKLVFSLCHTCAENKIAKCSHDTKARCLVGTWTTVEIAKALDKGYKILHIYEVQHFENQSTDLFKSYVRRFLKIKFESSKIIGDESEYRRKI